MIVSQGGCGLEAYASFPLVLDAERSSLGGECAPPSEQDVSQACQGGPCPPAVVCTLRCGAASRICMGTPIGSQDVSR